MANLTEIWRLFWAKTNREQLPGLPPDWTHPLWAHLLDVGSAAQILWNRFLPQGLKLKMVDALGMKPDEAGRFLSIWIGLHDLGKAIPHFQAMHTPTVEKLTATGLVFHDNPNRLHHGHASIAIVWQWLQNKGLPPDTLLDATAACVGIHHGKLCSSECWEQVAKDKQPRAVLGNADWRSAQLALAEAVFKAWGADWPEPKRFKTIGGGVNPWPDWLMAFAGWATLADWLGSMQRCYDTSVQAGDDLAAYVRSSLQGAERAYLQAGLNQQADLRELTFEEHFRYAPRPLQTIACRMSLSTDTPNLIIVEAPTGEGKTEAAFYLAARLRGGIYVAMPSQATSNGLFPRLRQFIQGNKTKSLAAAHATDTAALRLVHGNDLLYEEALTLLEIERETVEIADTDTTADKDSHSKGRLLSWFMPKKRALLVPYGVGTVDQLFLGVLYARHFFLRLFALCGKTVIFDEVHAYDTYMNTLFGRLLRWLRALDVHVVILSATLPQKTRQQMLQAWGCPEEHPEAAQDYPVAWHATAGKVTSYLFKPAPNRGQNLNFCWCDSAIESITEQAKTLLRQGATVIIICNQVKRAQRIFELLDDDSLLPAQDRMLLHARMPQSWRQSREKAALDRFGKDRPDMPGLLVGTQVIEQSLDLDADAMITDLAPVDLLLQRAGRLHRHQERKRPAGFMDPVFFIACPEPAADEVPDVDELSGNGYIYSKALLWKTWDVLRYAGGWALPLGEGNLPGYRQLIEAVYSGFSIPPENMSENALAAYAEAVRQWEKKDTRQEAEAVRRLVPLPKKLDDLFTFAKPELAEEEDASGGQLPVHMQALTRDPAGIHAEVLLMHRTDEGWCTQPDGQVVLDKNAIFLTPDALRAVFGASVRISAPGIVSALWQQENPEWSVQQKKHRVLQRFHLIEMINNQTVINGTRLILDKQLGLLLSKET